METNWKKETGFDIHRYGIAISEMNSMKTRMEQQTKIEKISLVTFLNEDLKNVFAEICRRLKKDDNSFYQNKDLHVTLFGFGSLEQKISKLIQHKVQQFSEQNRAIKMKISFGCVRPGAMYKDGKTLRPVQDVSNGTVVAYGDPTQNIDFFNYTNNLTKFLLTDEKIESKLGINFRRKFPAVWSTLGYYDKKENFKISESLEEMFKQYSRLSGNDLDISFPISEISLVKSNYKNLRYSKFIQKYPL